MISIQLLDNKCKIGDRHPPKALISSKSMNRSKLVAIITGAISIIVAIAYLILVQLLDFRGEMLPAPQSQLQQPPVATVYANNV